jgi:hypothetical protein
MAKKNTLATLGEPIDPGGTYEAEREYQPPPVIDWSRFFMVQPQGLPLPRVGAQYSTPFMGGNLEGGATAQPFGMPGINLRSAPIDWTVGLGFRRRF